MVPWQATAAFLAGLVIGQITTIASLWRANVTREDVREMIQGDPVKAVLLADVKHIGDEVMHIRAMLERRIGPVSIKGATD